MAEKNERVARVPKVLQGVYREVASRIGMKLEDALKAKHLMTPNGFFIPLCD